MPKQVLEYAPLEQRQEDPSHDAIARGVEAYVSLKTAYAALESYHQETVVMLKATEKERDFFKLELATVKNDLANAVAAANDSFRERDITIGILQQIAKILIGVDLTPPPAPQRRSRNGEVKKVENRQSDPVPVPSPEGGEVQPVRDVPTT